MRLTIFVAVLWLPACTPDAPAPEIPAADSTAAAPVLPDEALPYFVLGRPGPTFQADARPWIAPADTAARRARSMELFAEGRRQAELLIALDAAVDWREADARIRAFTGPDELPPHGASVKMLDRHLLRGPLDAERAAALGDYTQALLSQRSGEGAVLLVALRRLDGHWPDARRRSAARAAAARLAAVFAEDAGCVGCSVEEALAGMWPQKRASLENRLRDMETVHQQLMALATEDTPMPR